MEDYLLSRRITVYYGRTAIVHCAKDEEEMNGLLHMMDLDIVVIGAPKEDVCWLN